MAAQRKSSFVKYLFALFFCVVTSSFVMAHGSLRCRGKLPAVFTAHGDEVNGRGFLTPYSDNTRRGLVLLISFSDVGFSIDEPLAYYDCFFNEEGFSVGGATGSVHDYYEDQSQGRFNIMFDVLGPFALPKPAAYYGQNAGDGMDLHPAEMIQTALDTLAERYPSHDFSRYDWDGDGEANMVFAVYAGRGENYVTSQPSLMWPHMFTFTEQLQLYGDGVGRKSVGGIVFDRYACSSELRGSSGTTPEGIGTACHEFMHGLGIPDTYGSIPLDKEDMGYYDIMCRGNYLNDGRTPSSLAGFHKMMLGWSEAVEVSSSETVSMLAPVADGGEIYVMYNDDNRNECFVIENRQKTSWDAYIPAGGLKVTHIDYDEQLWEALMVNVDYTHPRMFFERESVWSSLPVYYGASGTFHLSIDDVSQSGSYMSFSIKDNPSDVRFPEMHDARTSGSAIMRYDLMGRKIPSNVVRPRGLYIEGGRLRLTRQTGGIRP